MRPSADRGDQAIIKEQIKVREERAREIRESFDKAKAKAKLERARDKFHER
jgi:hypothetical protein